MSISKGYTGAGGSLLISAHSANSFITIGQVLDLQFKPPTVSYEDTTNLGSTTQGGVVLTEPFPSKIDPGEVTASVLYVPNDSGLGNVRAAFNAQTVYDFKAQLEPSTPAGQTSVGDLYAYSGYISQYPTPETISPDKKITYKVVVKLVGQLAYTQGS